MECSTISEQSRKLVAMSFFHIPLHSTFFWKSQPYMVEGMAQKSRKLLNINNTLISVLFMTRDEYNIS